MRLSTLPAAAVLAALLSLGCGSKQTGTEGASCFPNGTCMAGLACFSNLCVNASGGYDAGAGAGDAGPIPTTCLIASISYPPGAVNPASACQTCQPAVSATEWADNCPSGKTCASGTCTASNKVMLVLDKSGSMKQHSEDENWGCCGTLSGSTCSGYDPAASCKWNIEKHLLVDTGGFLDQTKDIARFGLAVFPNKQASIASNDACMNGQILVDIGAGDNVQAVKDELNKADLQPLGGTPSAHMLQDISSSQKLVLNTADEKNTARYVILITDGMPNCNAALSGTTCTCTSSDCSNPLNCLDDVAMVDAVKRLYGNSVTTLVIGFGSGTSNPTAAKALNDAATAGAGKTTQYFQAANQADLQAILDQIKTTLQH